MDDRTYNLIVQQAKKYGDALSELSFANSRIETLEKALHEMLEIVATHRVYVGNSPAGELACEWTMDSIKEIHAKMEDVLARAALGEKKDA